MKKIFTFLLCWLMLSTLALQAQTPISTFPWEEGFENGGTIPTGWTTQTVSGSTDWEFVTVSYYEYTDPQSGSYMAEFVVEDYYGGVAKLITPEFDFSGISSTPTLSFSQFRKGYYEYIDELRVYYKAQSATTWTLLQAYTAEMAEWTLSTISLSTVPTTEPVQFAFEGISNWGDGVQLDNIQIFTCSPSTPILSSVTTTSASFSWDENEDLLGWFVSYAVVGQNWPEEEFLVTNEYEITDQLTPNTQYEFRLRTLCAVGDTSPSFILRFRTLCDIQLPFIESFDNTSPGSYSTFNAPDCWSFVREYLDAYAYVSTSSPYSSPHCYYLSNEYSASTQKLGLISPPINEDILDLRIQFQARGSSGYQLKVGYLTAHEDVSTFVLLQNISLTSNWAQYIVDISGIDTLTHDIANIVFLHGNTSTYQSIYLDDIIIDRIPPCENVNMADFYIPNNTTLTSITIDSRNATSDFNSYVFKYRKVGTPTWSDEETVTTFPQTISNLESGSNYEIIVKGLCDGGESFWSSVVNIGWTAFEIPITENFDTTGYFTGKGWLHIRNNTTGSLSYTTTAANRYSAPNALSFYNGTVATGHKRYFVSPKIDPAVNVNTLQIRFKARASVANANLSIGIMNSDSINSFELIETIPVGQTFGTYIVTFEGYTGTNRHIVIGHLNNPNESYIYLDDIHIETIQPCSEIANITYSGLNEEGITMTWREDDNTPYTIKYWEVGDTDTTEMTTSDNFYTLTGLDEMTSYVVTLSNGCSPTVWSDNYAFTTTMEPVAIPFNENFEGTDHAFVILNGTQTNQWMVGTDANAQPDGSTKSLYISSDASTNTYSITSTSYVYAYVTLDFDEAGSYIIDYDWKAKAESCCDYIQVWLAPADATFTAGTAPTTTGWINLYGSNLNNQLSWQHKTVSLNMTTAGLYHFIVYWRNDGSVGDNPPGAVDNITITRAACDEILSLEATNITTSSADIIFNTFPATTDVRLFYKESTETDWADSVDIALSTLTDNTYTLSSLTSGTIYNLAAKSLCTTSESVITSSYTLQTVCEAYALPWMEDFSVTTFPPTVCWDRKSGLYNPAAINYTVDLANSTSWTRAAVSGDNAARVYISGTTANYWLLSPIFELQDPNDYSLSFDLLLSSYSDASTSSSVNDIADDKFIILVSTDGGVSWNPQNTIVWNCTTTGDYRLDSLTNAYTTFTIPLSNYSGSVRFALYVESTVSGGYNYLFADNISISACPRPSELTATNITSQSATVSWMSNVEDGDFEYVLSQSSTTPDENDATSTNELTVDLDNLTDNTEYYFFIRANCDGGDNSEWTSIRFRTLCTPIAQLPFLENFEDTSATINCWKVVNNNNDGDKWTRYSSSTYARSGSYSYQLHTDFNAGNNDDYLISPQFTVTGNEYIKFYARAHSTGEPNDLQVLVSTTGTDPSDFTYVGMPLTTIGTTTYEEYTVDLGSIQGNISVAFHVPPGGLDGWNLYVDDVSIESYPDCVDPINITVTDFDTDHATLSWRIPGLASDVTGLELIYVECGADIQGETPISIPLTDTTYTLTNLDYQTCYDIYLKTVCAVGTTEWQEINFTTPCDVFALPFVETFETNSYALDCWAVWDFNNDGDRWGLYSSNAHSGSRCAGINTDYNSGNNNDYLISPALQFTGEDYISYFIKVHSSSEPNDYQLLFSTTGNSPADFTTVLHSETVSSTTYAQKEVVLPQHTGVGYIAFHIPQGGLDGWVLYIDDIYIGEVTDCTPVTDITATYNTNTDEAEISWNSENATQWQIAYSDDPNFNIHGDLSNATVIVVNTNPYSISGLEEAERYTFYVRSICASGDTSMWGWNNASLTVPCGALTLPYTENFDSYTGTTYDNAGTLPDCWNSFSDNTSYPAPHIVGSGYYHFSTSAPNGFTFTAGSDGANTYAILPEFTDPISAMSISFDFAVEYASYGVMKVGYVTDPNNVATFTSLYTCANTETMTTITIDFSEYTIPAEAKNIAFYWMYSSSYYSAGIDDVNVYLTQISEPCDPPTNLRTVNVTSQTAEVSWTAGGSETEWIVEHRKGTDNYGTQRVTQTSATLTGLDPDTQYDLRVKAVCATDNESAYTETTFTTREDGEYYTITPSVDGSGTINPNTPQQVAAGGSQLFTFSASNGYQIEKVLINDQEEDWNTTDNSYQFTNVQQDYTIKVVFSVGIDDRTLNQSVEIFPNPTNSLLHVKTESLFETVEITNMLGQVIYKTTINDLNFSINVSQFNAGVYFIKLSGENGNAVKKFVVN